MLKAMNNFLSNALKGLCKDRGAYSIKTKYKKSIRTSKIK